MAFEELHSIPVSKVDTTIDIVGKGDGGHERDEVLVTSSVTLVSDLGSESVTLLLPLASDAQQKPVVRYTDEPLTGPAVFEFDEVERSEYDEQLVERLGRLADGSSKREQRDVAVSIGRCASSISAAVLQVKPGQRELRLFYKIAAERVGDREFEFAVIGPLPSFVIQPGGTIGVVTVMPRNTQVIFAQALQNPNDPASEIGTRQDSNLGYRQLIVWTWQNDPLFKVRYRYA